MFLYTCICFFICSPCTVTRFSISLLNLKCKCHSVCDYCCCSGVSVGVLVVYAACRHLTFNHRDLWTVKHFPVIHRHITLSCWVNPRPSGTCSKIWQTAVCQVLEKKHLLIQGQREIYCLQLRPSWHPWKGLLMTQSIHNLFHNFKSFCGHQKTKLINYQQWSQQALQKQATLHFVFINLLINPLPLNWWPILLLLLMISYISQNDFQQTPRGEIKKSIFTGTHELEPG